MLEANVRVGVKVLWFVAEHILDHWALAQRVWEILDSKKVEGGDTS